MGPFSLKLHILFMYAECVHILMAYHACRSWDNFVEVSSAFLPSLFVPSIELTGFNGKCFTCQLSVLPVPLFFVCVCMFSCMCVHQYRYWKLNPGPMQEQQMLLTNSSGDFAMLYSEKPYWRSHTDFLP